MQLFFKKQAVPIDLGEADAEAPVPDGAPLAEAMAHVREAHPLAETIPDHYRNLDVLAEGVAKTFPTSFCKAGCSGCCHYPVGLFTITFTEWDLMRAHMETVWTEAQRADFVRRYERTFTAFWKVVLGYLQHNFVSLLVTAPLIQRSKIACPFLVDDRCSIYAARPYQCRTFGLFAARTGRREPRVYACNLQGENLLEQLQAAGPRIELPVMNPIVREIRKRCSGPKLALPVWAGIWVRKQRKP